MIQVLEIFDNGTAVVSTDGLFRVLIESPARPIGELLERDDADSLASFYDSTHPGEHASITSYAVADQSSSSFSDN